STAARSARARRWWPSSWSCAASPPDRAAFPDRPTLSARSPRRHFRGRSRGHLRKRGPPIPAPSKGAALTVPRLLAVGFIFCCSAIAWSTLGASVVARTGESDQRLAKEVAQLWGGHHEQLAPTAAVVRPRQVTEQVLEQDARGQAVARNVTRTVLDQA